MQSSGDPVQPCVQSSTLNPGTRLNSWSALIAEKSRGWCPAGRPLPGLSLFEFSLRRPLKRFTAKFFRDTRKEIGRQTRGADGAVLGVHQFQGVAHEFFQGRGGSGIQRFQLRIQLFGDGGHGDKLRLRSLGGKNDFQVGAIVGAPGPHHSTAPKVREVPQGGECACLSVSSASA